MPDDQDLLTPAEAAAVLDISSQTLRWIAKTAGIPYETAPNSHGWLWPASSVTQVQARLAPDSPRPASKPALQQRIAEQVGTIADLRVANADLRRLLDQQQQLQAETQQ